jgi:ribosomal protein L7/L12
MTLSPARLAVVSVLACAVCSGAHAQTDPQAAAFVKSLVDAINSKSVERRKALIHPAALVCATPGSAAMTDDMLMRQARHVVPSGYKWTMTPVPKDQPPLFSGQFDYLVLPTHVLQIDFETGPNSSTGILLQVVREGNAWREVTACPKPETVAAAKQAAKARTEQEAKVRQLVRTMAPKTRAEIAILLKEGRRIEAIKSYRAASGEDLSTAKAVVDSIAPGITR